jgi:hypothetical protein
MTVTKANADVLDLTDAYAFSGTVTGTNAGATTLISRTAFTTASTVDITGFDSSLYDSYEILMHCIVSNDASGIYGRTSSDGGSTFDAGSGNYTYTGFFTEENGTNITGFGSQSATQLLLTLNDTVGNASGESFDVRLRLIRPDASAGTLTSWVSTYVESNALSTQAIGMGKTEILEDVDGFQFLPSAGTITGSYQFIGYNKA